MTSLMTDESLGTLRPEVLGERVLSALIEFDVGEDRVPALAAVLKAAAGEVDTVFSVGLAAPLRPDESEAHLFQILRDHEVWHRPNGKTNVGLGRPFQEALE